MLYATSYLHTKDTVVLVGVIYEASLGVQVSLDKRVELSYGILICSLLSTLTLVSVTVDDIINEKIVVARVDSPTF